MCGICGKYNFSPEKTIDETVVKKMNNKLYHRGPDDEGYFFENNVGLGSRRLSIIDIQKGKQPIYNEDRNLCIVFNGEIYNFQEIKQRLIKKGHKFLTDTDTEVILHLYEEKGNGCLSDLNGMFVFVIWDRKNKKLFIARDRLGIKPMFYARTKESLLFASEIKALLEDPIVKKEENPRALHSYLSYNYVPSPHTLFKNIYKLPAGCYMECSEKGIFINKYWDIQYSNEFSGTENSYWEKFCEVLERAVKKRLISDVPLGIFLSGGLDSSSILYCASKFCKKPIKTFSIGFEEKNYDERRFSRRMAECFNTEHQEMVFEADWVKILKDTVWHLDGLVANTTAIPLYYLSKFAKNSVTVALSGLGGDEILGGYDTYIADILVTCYKKTPQGLRKSLRSFFLKTLPASESVHSLSFKMRHFLNGAEHSSDRAHYWWRQIFSEEEKNLLYTAKFSREDPYSFYQDAFDKCDAKSDLNKFLYADTKIWLNDSELAITDMMGMANSLEIRTPFLDHELVEFMASMPVKTKINGLRKKHILKKAMLKKLPRNILNRQKRGFSVPFCMWIKSDLKEMVLDTMYSPNANKINMFNRSYIKTILEDHFAGKTDNSRKIFGLLNYFLWYDMFMKG